MIVLLLLLFQLFQAEIPPVQVFYLLGGTLADCPISEISCAMQAKVQIKGDHRLGSISLIPWYEITLMVTDLGL